MKDEPIVWDGTFFDHCPVCGLWMAGQWEPDTSWNLPRHDGCDFEGPTSRKFRTDGRGNYRCKGCDIYVRHKPEHYEGCPEWREGMAIAEHY